MNITNHLKKPLITLAIAAIVLATGGVAAAYYLNTGTDQQLANASSTTSSTAVASDNSDDIDWTSLPTTNVALTNDGFSITAAGTYVLSGSSTGQVSVKSDGNVRLVLNGVTIKSNSGPAIYIESANNAVIQLADGSSNSITDASTRSDQTIDGAIYSADDLVINGTGKLAVTATFADGIVGKDDVWINSGTISVTSVDDGIRGKDSLSIVGGTITIDAKGDGIKTSNDSEAGKGQLVISGGTTTISSGSQAVQAEQKVSISGGKLDIKTSVEGIEAPVIVIDNGDITLYASDDGINAGASTFITTGLSVTINGGTLNVEVGSGDTDAIDSNGDIYVNGGTINITAPTSSFDYDGTGELKGGTVTVNGQHITEMPAQMMGGGGGPRR